MFRAHDGQSGADWDAHGAGVCGHCDWRAGGGADWGRDSEEQRVGGDVVLCGRVHDCGEYVDLVQSDACREVVVDGKDLDVWAETVRVVHWEAFSDG